MKQKPVYAGIGAFAAMLILILDSQTAAIGAKEGIALCLTTVIPSLFPFFLISILLTSSLSGVSLPFLRPFGKLLGLPPGTEAILISGFLGGYPAGAQSVCAAWKSGQLSKDTAERMLALCNNAGPSFLFGMSASIFCEKWAPWALWGILIFSSVLTSFLLPPNLAPPTVSFPGGELSVTQALRSAIQIMGTVCGWVVLFRVLICFLRRWILWILPAETQVLIIGFLELSNGCCELANVSSFSLRFVLCAIFLACGGLCVGMQTRAVTAGLSLGCYCFGKLIQTLFCLILSFSVISGYGIPVMLSAVLFVMVLQKQKNKSSISGLFGV